MEKAYVFHWYTKVAVPGVHLLDRLMELGTLQEKVRAPGHAPDAGGGPAEGFLPVTSFSVYL